MTRLSVSLRDVAKEKWTFSIDSMVKRKFLIIINPFSGSGKAPKIFKNQITPILNDHGCCYEVVTTCRRNEAFNYVHNCANLFSWDAIVIISGDGLIFEVFNGLMARDDWEKAVKLPVGVIPGGSGNGLAASIEFYSGMKAFQNSIISCALNVVMGCPHPIDLVKVTMQNKTVYSFLSIGWGLIADIDIESEGLRFLGQSRFTIWSIYRSLATKTYRGVLSYLPVTRPESSLPKQQLNNSGYEISSCCQMMLQSEPCLCGHHTDSNQNPSKMSITSTIGDEQIEAMSNNSDDYGADHHAPLFKQTNHDDGELIPGLSEPVPSSWVTVEEDFVMIHTASQTHLSTSVCFAPESSLSDGIIWLFYLTSKASTKNLLQFLSSLQDSRHVTLPFVNIVPVRAFRLKPLTDNGVLAIDGESMKVESFQAEVLPAMARVLTNSSKNV